MDIKEAISIRRDGVFPDDMGGTERAYKTAEASDVLADAYLAQLRIAP